MKHRAPAFLISLATALAIEVLLVTARAQEAPPAASLARAVRLSFVEGTVTVQRPGSSTWAKASVNTPLQQGFSVATAQNSFGEIQFENGSTVRLGQLSRIDFSALALTRDGDKLNHLNFEEGYATFHFIPEHHDEYLVKTSGFTLTPHGKAEFRADLQRNQLRVEVSDGDVQVADAIQSKKLGKGEVLTCEIGSNAPFQFTHGIDKDDWDKWVAARDEQSKLAYNDSAVSIDAPMYGWGDLDAYGDWGYFPGYGYGWAPYEPLGWSPYGMGMWNWYPGWGYTWISGEPWGWLPFHYGLWNFDPIMGWFWMPGSFGMWSPALVNWYSGPGWIGWTSIDAGGAPCTLGGAGCMTAVTPGTLSNGRPIRPLGPGIVHPDPNAPIHPIARPAIEPTQMAKLSGQPLAKNVVFPGGPRGALLRGNGRMLPASALRGNSFPGRSAATGPIRSTNLARGVGPSGLARTAGLRRGPAAAPSSVIMGRTVTPDTVLARHSFFECAFVGEPRGPARAPLGGAYHGPARMGGLAFSRSSGGFARAGGGFGHVGGSFGMARSGGAGFGGGFHGGGLSGGFHGGGIAAGHR